MIKTILVTGGTGYIGSHTVLDLIKNGYRVVILDDFSNSSPKVLEQLEKLAGESISLYNVDLKDAKQVEAVFAAEEIDAVINFAGYKAVGESVEQPLKYYENNLIGLINLVKAMQEFAVKKLIFSSSATVYGQPEIMPLKESDPIGNVTNPYGRTKLIIEEILTDICAANEDFGVVTLRYFNPLGADESGEIGEDPNGIPNNLAPYITQVAIGKLEKLSVFGGDYPTEDGTCIRDYVHVADLAAGHTKALDYLFQDNQGYEIFNLGSGVGYSVYQIIDNFEKVVGRPIPYQVVGRRAGDIPVSYAAIDKAKAVLNWSPTKDIGIMCADTWRWQQKHPNGFQD
ncbi:MAG: UDP-glucose 4-epimerase GalE [Streptococcaceae bacterium]|jgi:UDP-glucose 4-epimerase|nr:UDP-glucose 4-epimerase GalE [Streptococcaceae bacterium]